MAEERLQNILSHAGVASRRHAADLIAAGRVTVDGLVVRETHRDDDAIDAGGSSGTSGFSGSPAAPTTEPSIPA